MEELNGTLEFTKSRGGRGCTFTLELFVTPFDREHDSDSY